MNIFTRIAECFIGLAFFVAAYFFYGNIDRLYKTMNMAQGEQMIYWLLIVLCAGFGALMIKGK